MNTEDDSKSSNYSESPITPPPELETIDDIKYFLQNQDYDDRLCIALINECIKDEVYEIKNEIVDDYRLINILIY